MTEPYDSRKDTMDHIERVAYYVDDVSGRLSERARAHDLSKLSPAEKDAFDRGTPNLKSLTYGSDEYREAFSKYGMKDAIAHHYANNSHHPEHFENGIDGMSLLDVMEMLCDWKAATERHADGDMARSLEINRNRFGIDGQLYSIILNTARELGMVTE